MQLPRVIIIYHKSVQRHLDDSQWPQLTQHSCQQGLHRHVPKLRRYVHSQRILWDRLYFYPMRILYVRVLVSSNQIIHHHHQRTWMRPSRWPLGGYVPTTWYGMVVSKWDGVGGRLRIFESFCKRREFRTLSLSQCRPTLLEQGI